MRRKTTIVDVAREAGVARSTVSKIVNGNQRFARETEERVWKAVSQLGYTASPHAQTMSTGKTQALGIVILDVLNPHFTAVTKGASLIAARNGYSLLLADAEEDPSKEEQLIRALQARTDGLVLAGSRLPDNTLSALSSGTQPIVVIGRRPGDGIASVAVDEYSAAYQLTSHLIARGRRRITYLAGPHFWVNHERQRGYEQALLHANLPSHVMSLASPDMQGGELAVGSICSMQPRPDALVVYFDLPALGVISGLRAVGLTVPDDVAVAAFGHLDILDHLATPLTTVDIPSQKLGEVATRLLVELLHDASPAHLHLTMPARLQLRAST